MAQEGKYLYCIINENDGRNFGPMGIGGRGDIISTIGFNDISAVISDTSMTHYVISRMNLIHHEEVIEKVMKEYAVLPVRFCTIASDAEEIRSLLRRRYSEFKGLLRDMDNKIEVGVKAYWKGMPQILQEIDGADPTVQRLKKEWERRPDEEIVKGELGKAVKEAMACKKIDEGGPLVNRLRRISVDVKEKVPQADPMVFNVACLIDRTHEKAFDYLIDELSEKYEDRLSFIYVGPAPPFHFINIEIKA